MNIGMTVTGAKEMERMFERLEKKEAAKIVRKETRDAQKMIMRPEIGARALGLSTGTGGGMGALIAKNLAIRAMTKMRRGSYGAKVIIKANDAFVYITADGTRHYIPNAIEYGHAAPYDAGGVKVAAPKPFMRPAYEAKRRPLAEYFAKKTILAIERAAKI